MSVAVAEEPRVLHTLPGRVRVHVPAWSGQGKRRIETQLRQIQGVHSVQASDLTHNMLVQYDPPTTNEHTILAHVRALDLNLAHAPEDKATPPPVHREKQGHTVRARIAVRGLERDLHLAKHVLDRLQSHPGVHASVNPLTGRVLVEFDEHEVKLEDLVADVSDVELPDLPEEDRPAYPLDPGPLIQSASRTIGATLGLGLLAVRRLFAFQEPLPGSTTALQASTIIGILQGIPPVRYGLRLLMVAEGASDTPLDDPQGLTALGFVGISDPLRDTVQAAVRRCHEAGVRVIMITGDHPATARTIAREAGLLNNGGDVLTATEIAELHNGELDERLEHAVVISRATPLDKLRIIESLQQHGQTVAMTGDGVNDAPALRLADVGVAMGRGGREVARQTADVVLADDDFSTLVESFVEGRSFWRNIRRALGLLLGGNLGELGLVVGASLLGGGNAPLTASQILAVNAITDILPALADALQRPEDRNLAALSREGEGTLNKPLRNEVFSRGSATALPSLLSYLIMLGAGALPEARSVAFASIVGTQLAQTLDAGRAEGTLTRPVLAAVAGSTGVLLAAFALPPLRQFLQLVVLSPLGWALIGSGALVAVVLHRLFVSLSQTHPALTSLPAPAGLQLASTRVQ